MTFSPAFSTASFICWTALFAEAFFSLITSILSPERFSLFTQFAKSLNCMADEAGAWMRFLWDGIRLAVL